MHGEKTETTVLLGTTNPSKVRRFERLLSAYSVSFLTLEDLGITEEPEECGRTPRENAVLKAKFYGRYFDRVLCNDAGLYFRELDRDDIRQPGLHIRTPGGGPRLDDEAMIAYYSELIHSLGGKVCAYYLDGIAVYNRGKTASFQIDSEQDISDGMFYMVDTPSEKRHAGWPLDSLSLNRDTLTYFADAGNRNYDTKATVIDTPKDRLVRFLAKAFELRFRQENK